MTPEIGNYVEVISLSTINHPINGRVINIRHDDRLEAIYTIELDDCTDTTDGLCVARVFELMVL